MKKYPIKPNKAQMKIFKKGWKRFQRDLDYLWKEMSITEKWMSRKTGIEGIEFFKADMGGDWCGIGNADRTMKLLQRESLE